ncbi:hypothetical protein ACOME3_008050 [Neoechinorhynchus agilis]
MVSTDQNEVPELIEDSAKIPVTIITGLIGSGKTTLLNRILRQTAGKKKIAVILNEFEPTAIDVERTMFVGSSGKLCEQWIELPSGCLCCSTKDAIVKVLEGLINKARVDHVVVETSGLANPAKLINSLWLDEGLEVQFELKCVICLVDSSKVHEKCLEFKNEWETQMAYADIIILNKLDLVVMQDINELRIAISSLNPFAHIHTSTYCQMDVENLLTLDMFNLADFRASEAQDELRSLESVKHSESVSAIKSYCINGKGFFTRENLNQLMATLLWEELHCMKILRMKALIWMEEQCASAYKFTSYVIQAVDERYDE